jgi:hypothetical protein
MTWDGDKLEKALQENLKLRGELAEEVDKSKVSRSQRGRRRQQQPRGHYDTRVFPPL